MHEVRLLSAFPARQCAVRKVHRAQHQVGHDCPERGQGDGSNRGRTVVPQLPAAPSLTPLPHAAQVQSEHILLGLIAEDEASKAGFLNSALTVEKAKGTIEGLSGKRQSVSTTETINFSRGVRRTFEIASNVSRGSRGPTGVSRARAYLSRPLAGVQAIGRVLHLPRAHPARAAQHTGERRRLCAHRAGEVSARSTQLTCPHALQPT